MNKLKLGFAALIVAITLSSCGDAASDAIVAAIGNIPIKPDGTTETSIVVTFKNGWENAPETELVDDPYTEEVNINKALSPSTVNAVVDSAELAAYETNHKAWKDIKDVWDEYNLDMEAAMNDGEDPPPPPLNLFLPNLFLL